MSQAPASGWVFVASLGPVQGFIGAARRTRDLWYGSRLLSDLSRELATSLEALPGAWPIFPAPAALPPAKVHLIQAPVSNKIVVCLQAQPGADCAAVARALRDSLHALLRRVGTSCLRQLGRRGREAVDAAAFRAQWRDALGLYCAWASFAEPGGRSYPEAYEEAHRLLDARKACRDFVANPVDRAGAYLSSLGGERESVLADGLPRMLRATAAPAAVSAASRLRLRMGIEPHEHLDAVGLTKRVLGRGLGFPSITRVALQPWVQSWSDDLCRQLGARLDPLSAFDMVRRYGCVNPDPMARFPFDCELLLASRRAEWRRVIASEVPPFDEAVARERAHEMLDDLEAFLKGSHESLRLPADDPLHVALLAADGDRMGEILANPACATLAVHRKVSEVLAGFAIEAGGIVRAHGGTCIYAGGDDVLALLPVGSALRCAEELRNAYASTLARAVPDLVQPRPTMSTGLAFGHVLAPLGGLRADAEGAKLAAKQGADGKGLRNALGMVVHPRSGAARLVVDRWEAAGLAGGAGSSFVNRMEHWREAFETGQSSGSLPYDLPKALRGAPRDALAGLARRVLERRGNAPGAVFERLVQDHLARRKREFVDEDPGRTLLALADEWYVARWLSACAAPSPALVVTRPPAMKYPPADASREPM